MECRSGYERKHQPQEQQAYSAQKYVTGSDPQRMQGGPKGLWLSCGARTRTPAFPSFLALCWLSSLSYQTLSTTSASRQVLSEPDERPDEHSTLQDTARCGQQQPRQFERISFAIYSVIPSRVHLLLSAAVLSTICACFARLLAFVLETKTTRRHSTPPLHPLQQPGPRPAPCPLVGGILVAFSSLEPAAPACLDCSPSTYPPPPPPSPPLNRKRTHLNPVHPSNTQRSSLS